MKTIDLRKLAQDEFSWDGECQCGRKVSYRMMDDGERFIYSLLAVHHNYAVETTMQLQTFNEWPKAQVDDLILRMTCILQIENQCINPWARFQYFSTTLPKSWRMDAFSFENNAWADIQDRVA